MLPRFPARIQTAMNEFGDAVFPVFRDPRVHLSGVHCGSLSKLSETVANAVESRAQSARMNCRHDQ
jgi:hypothetical protein